MPQYVVACSNVSENVNEIFYFLNKIKLQFPLKTAKSTDIIQIQCDLP